MAYGDIGAVIDTLEFVTTDILNPDILHVSGDVFAIVYTDIDGDGQLVTITIEADGNIGAAIIDSLEFDPAQCGSPEIIHVSGDVFAIVYGDIDSDGMLVTVEIGTGGAIGAAVIDSYEFETVNCFEPYIIHISGDVFAIVYQGVDGDGWLVTVTIGTGGAITKAIIDSFEFEISQCTIPEIIHVSGDVFAIVYGGVDADGWMVTVTIGTDGAIGAAVIDSYEFDAVAGAGPKIVHVSGDVFAIAFQGADYDGWLVTVTIGTGGAITKAIIDSFEYDAVASMSQRIIQISETIYCIAYTDSAYDGWLKTITIEADGNIGAAIIDSLEFDPVNGDHISIIHVSGDTYTVVYKGVDSDGFIKTIDISTPLPAPTEIVHHEMLMGMGP